MFQRWAPGFQGGNETLEETQGQRKTQKGRRKESHEEEVDHGTSAFGSSSLMDTWQSNEVTLYINLIPVRTAGHHDCDDKDGWNTKQNVNWLLMSEMEIKGSFFCTVFNLICSSSACHHRSWKMLKCPKFLSPSLFSRTILNKSSKNYAFHKFIHKSYFALSIKLPKHIMDEHFGL